MTRYWVIAPYDSERPDIFEAVWKYDLDNSVISIGWSELGDFSALSSEELKKQIQGTYPQYNQGTVTRVFNMLWSLYHDIQEGDLIMARKGRKTLAAVGNVTRTAFYNPGEWSTLDKDVERPQFNFLSVNWHVAPRNKVYDQIVFGMQALYEIDEAKYRELIEEVGVGDFETDVEDQLSFVLEKYLQDFIVSNFKQIFGNDLILYEEEGVIGKEYTTDIGRIDILAWEPATNSYIVIELKKGRGSDRVVGQTLRYMGWVEENLCEEGQDVKGLIICKGEDVRLNYALKIMNNINVKYYNVDFQLSDTPFCSR